MGCARPSVVVDAPMGLRQCTGQEADAGAWR